MNNQDLTKNNQGSNKADLISRKALREEINNYLTKRQDVIIWDVDMFNMLDNVPTVEPEKVLVAQVTLDKDQLKELIQTNVIDKIKSGELFIEEKITTGEWIPVSERLPEEKLFNPSGSDFGFDFGEVLCTTIWGDVRAYKFGKPIGHDKPHFWLGGGIMDEYVIAWQELPEPYKKGDGEL